MNMTVPLLTTQRQDINSLRLDTFADCFCRLINDTLKSKIFGKSKVTRHLLLMFDWGNQCVSVKNRIPIKEYDYLIILFDNMIAVQAARNHFADKARTTLYPLNV